MRCTCTIDRSPTKLLLFHPTIIRTAQSLWTWLWGRYHVPQNVFLVCTWSCLLALITADNISVYGQNTCWSYLILCRKCLSRTKDFHPRWNNVQWTSLPRRKLSSVARPHSAVAGSWQPTTVQFRTDVEQLSSWSKNICSSGEVGNCFDRTWRGRPWADEGRSCGTSDIHCASGCHQHDWWLTSQLRRMTVATIYTALSRTLYKQLESLSTLDQHTISAERFVVSN